MKQFVCCVLAVMAASVIPLTAGAALAVEPDPVEQIEDALEAELLDELEDDLGDETGGEPDRQRGETGDDKDLTEDLTSVLEKELGGALGEDAGLEPQEENPLARIGRRMRTVEQMIAEKKAIGETRKQQGQIVKELNALIDELRRRKKQQSGSGQQSMGSRRTQVRQPGKQASGGKNSRRPARDSTERMGTADVRDVDVDDMKAMLKDLWGHLPQRQREQMLQWSAEEFLPKYDLMIREYFLRLAEEPQDGARRGDER